VSPFCGSVTGAFLYDAFVYTGVTPVNTPWFGLKQFMKPHRVIQNRIEQQEADGMV
jgi:aquaglyceroporin related protein